jgi:hypothetical protein
VELELMLVPLILSKLFRREIFNGVNVEGAFRVNAFEDSGKLTVNAIKSSALETIKALIQIVLQMTGRILSNVVREEINRYCSCGKKMIVSGRGVKTKILSMFGYISCYTPFLLTQV